MISEEVENRISNWFYQHYLSEGIQEEVESLLLPYFLKENDPSSDEMVWKAIEIIQRRLKEQNK